jgi:uncharacterized protein YoxC
MARATWTLDEVEKVIRKVYSTENTIHKQLNGIKAQAEKNQHDNAITLTDITRGMVNMNANLEKFISVILELDAIE